MKTGYFFILACTLALGTSAQHKKVSVLFVGNSYLAVNNLPLLLDSIVTAGGDTLEWDISAPGGYTLKQHSTDANTLAKISQQQWDYVVLQEQSQLPSLHPDSVDSTTIPYALFLDSLIQANNPCTQTVFFETWGRRYGDASNCAAYPPVCTYNGMQQRLMESYKLMADTCHGIVAPVGEAFRACIAYDSTVNLYQADYSHPSLEGSFLAASVFYNVFFRRSANGNPYDPGVTQLPAYIFHLAARQVVKDSLNFWNLGVYEPWAEFTWDEVAACYVEFYGNSNSNFSHFWDFGDTTFSTDANPAHQYLNSRYWPVMHIVYDSCSSDTFRLVNNVVCLGAGMEESGADKMAIYPNPARNQVTVSGGFPATSIQIFSLLGERVLDLGSTQDLHQVDVSGLAEGIYFMKISGGENQFSTVRFAIAR